MDSALRRYLRDHRERLDASALAVAAELAHPKDTDRDARRLISDARAALRAAIASALAAGPVEGRPIGISGEIVIQLRIGERGQGSVGYLFFGAARLGAGGVIPCPDTWPQDSAPLPLPSHVEALHASIFRPSGQRLVEVDQEGKAELGRERTGRQYLVDELPGDELWLRALDPPQE